MAAGASRAMGMECGIEQGTSRGCLSFKAGGKKGGEEPSSVDASGQHGFHGNPSSLFLLGVDATKRLLA